MMLYAVVGIHSASYDRFAGYPKWRGKRATKGPFVRHSTAVKWRAKMIAARCILDHEDGGPLEDMGPVFKAGTVRIIGVVR